MDYGWLGAEGEQNGMPFLLRLRDIPSDDVFAARARYPHLLVTTWRFPKTDLMGLPSSSQHHRIERYEERLLKALERTGQGILALRQTHDGTVEHSIYVGDINSSIARIRKRNTSSAEMAFCVDENDEWEGYIAIREALSERPNEVW